MSGWTTDVLIYSSIVGLLLPRHDDLAFTLSTNYLNTVLWNRYVRSAFGMDSTIPRFDSLLASREPKYIICIVKRIEAFAGAKVHRNSGLGTSTATATTETETRTDLFLFLRKQFSCSRWFAVHLPVAYYHIWEALGVCDKVC
jgi:hypothetical protein